MNANKNNSEWNTLREKIQTKFSKLSESDIDGLQGHMSQLTAKVQKAYNYNKEKAEAECKPFLRPSSK